MEWTKEKPTECGFYWYVADKELHPDYDETAFTPSLLHIRRTWKEPHYKEILDILYGRTYDFDKMESLDGYWNKAAYPPLP